MRALNKKSPERLTAAPGGWGKMIKYYHPFTFNYTTNFSDCKIYTAIGQPTHPKDKLTPSQGDKSRVGRLHLIQGGKP